MTRQWEVGPGFKAFETLTVAGTSVGFTAGTAKDYTYALVTAEVAQVRYRLDGTDPTASVGHILDVGGILTLDSSEQVVGFRAIRTGGVSGSLSVSFGR